MLCMDCECALPRIDVPGQIWNLLANPAIANHISHQHIDNLVVVSPYQHPLDQWITALKFQRRADLARLLGMLLAKHLQQLFQKYDEKPEILMPVPLHWRRLKIRQYNQAYLLAKQVSKQCQLPIDYVSLLRKKATATQVGLGGKKRRGNLRGAFAINKGASLPEHVGIIDDVITTGSTVNEIARVLKRQGVKKVSVYCVALSVHR
ncbi:ComF family protein [Thalassotalea sp. PS06]|uniref:ComF family protein n=1 Tax=Thalassotalea sp. PS06 TaxID=2594005 RepID=UPI00163DB45F|nr:ComF family protein [Thalassotalea sp. PS06]